MIPQPWFVSVSISLKCQVFHTSKDACMQVRACHTSWRLAYTYATACGENEHYSHWLETRRASTHLINCRFTFNTCSPVRTHPGHSSEALLVPASPTLQCQARWPHSPARHHTKMALKRPVLIGCKESESDGWLKSLSTRSEPFEACYKTSRKKWKGNSREKCQLELFIS